MSHLCSCSLEPSSANDMPQVRTESNYSFSDESSSLNLAMICASIIWQCKVRQWASPTKEPCSWYLAIDRNERARLPLPHLISPGNREVMFDEQLLAPSLSGILKRPHTLLAASSAYTY